MSSAFIDSDARGLPLEGIVVVDLTMALAGPLATKILADMGACVVKVEGPSHYDMSRGPVTREDFRPYAKDWPNGQPFNRSGWYHKHNRNKYGITLDLKHPEGRRILLDLVKHADAIVENFSARVLDSLDISYDQLRVHNPRLVLVSMPAFGLSGPEKDYVAFGSALEMLAGFVALRGYKDSMPLRSGINYVDPVSGFLAAFVTLAGIVDARRTGTGRHLEVSQLEAGLSMLGEFFLDWSVNGRLSEPAGNESDRYAPQNSYQCQGDDAWIALSVQNDQVWQAVVHALDLELLGISALWSLEERKQHLAVIDHAMQLRIAVLTVDEILTTLRPTGIAIARVNTAKDLFVDPQLAHRRFFETVDHPASGPRQHPSTPWLSNRRRIPIRRPAPLFGEHNEHILGGWLGIDPNDLRRLEELGVISTSPLVDVWGDRDNRPHVDPAPALQSSKQDS